MKRKVELEKRIAERSSIDDQAGVSNEDQMGTSVEEDVVAKDNGVKVLEEVATTTLQELLASMPSSTSTFSSSSTSTAGRVPLPEDEGELSQATFLIVADVDHQHEDEQLDVYLSPETKP